VGFDDHLRAGVFVDGGLQHRTKRYLAAHRSTTQQIWKAIKQTKAQ
jgi:hypothetical protein